MTADRHRRLLAGALPAAALASLTSLSELAASQGDIAADRLPVLFIGHGSPMNAIRDNDFTRMLQAWGLRLRRPKAILDYTFLYALGASDSLREVPQTVFEGFHSGTLSMRCLQFGAA